MYIYIQSHSRHLPKRNENMFNQRPVHECLYVYIAFHIIRFLWLSVISKNWKPPTYLSPGKQINCDIATGGNKKGWAIDTWMKLKGIVLSESIHKRLHCMNLICAILTKATSYRGRNQIISRQGLNTGRENCLHRDILIGVVEINVLYLSHG